jgi:hypothetical protein
MADVGKIMGVVLSNIKNIYDTAVSGLDAIIGVGLGGTTAPTESVDFSFDGNYTPPDGDDVDFF